jgi:hypothetical protein
MPIAVAVSSTAFGIDLKASAVLTKMGGIASTLNAITAGFTPVPMMGMQRKSTARLGITRSVEKMPVTATLNAGLPPQIIPSGIPMQTAANIDTALTVTCSPKARK